MGITTLENSHMDRLETTFTETHCQAIERRMLTREIESRERAAFEAYALEQKIPLDTVTIKGVTAYEWESVEKLWQGWLARAAQAEAVTLDMRYAVRFAPSSAHWSQRLLELLGPDAREGINALEQQLREARAALHSYPSNEENLFFIQNTRQFAGRCVTWWTADRNGYVSRLDQAGKFTKEEAEAICKNRSMDRMWACAAITPIAGPTVDVEHLPQ